MRNKIDISSQEENKTIKKQQHKVSENKNGNIEIDLKYLFDSKPHPIQKSDLESITPKIIKYNQMLLKGEGECLVKGIPMTGWLHLPEKIDPVHIKDVQETADKIAGKIDVFMSLGIGGSYLGIEAAWKALTHNYWNQLTLEQRGGRPEIYFLGQNMDPDFFRDTLDIIAGKRVALNVISKSGTTTETAIAFRILRKMIEDTYGYDYRDYIIATTDKEKGALRRLAEEEGFKTFVVPDNIGGRFSVMSDVGLLGLAVVGIDIAAFISGFKAMKQRTDTDDFWHNPSMIHAAARYVAYAKGKRVEVIATNSTSIYHIGRWMEQLFPESEGHKGKGMWVSPSMYSEKLHANGQMVQNGERNIFETFLKLENHDNSMKIPVDKDNLDDLNYLPDNGKDMNFINKLVIDGPAFAHHYGGVPNITISIPERSAYHIGALMMMMERSVALSGYLLGHNPFTQPGVEAYKKAVFTLAGKPGYEK